MVFPSVVVVEALVVVVEGAEFTTVYDEKKIQE